MQAWELSLKVRRRACEFRLYNYRVRHSRVVEERSSKPEMGPSWCKRDDLLGWLRDGIRRELAEIEFIKMLANVGPIKGNKMVLHVRDGLTHKVRPGPSIIDLIQREAERLRNQPGLEMSYEYSEEHLVEAKANGLEKALEILYNPYKFLDDDERAAYDKAEASEQEIVDNRSGGPPETMANEKAGKPKPTLNEIRAQAQVVERRGARPAK